MEDFLLACKVLMQKWFFLFHQASHHCGLFIFCFLQSRYFCFELIDQHFTFLNLRLIIQLYIFQLRFLFE